MVATHLTSHFFQLISNVIGVILGGFDFAVAVVAVPLVGHVL